MGSLGKYAGQPLSFACAKCRRGDAFRRGDGGAGRKITLTGKTRQQSSAGMNYHHWPNIAYQYRCDECGHVGWSRHPRLKSLFDRTLGTRNTKK